MAQYDPAWLEKMYNNRARVPEHGDYFRRWDGTSAVARAAGGPELDVAYGDGPKETLDIFVPDGQSRALAGKAPVLVFIHGGWWRSLDKSDHSFVAPAYTGAGACVVIPNYELCPATTIPGIALQMVKALAWVYRNIGQYGGDPTRITVAGHSAGGHLAAMMLACQWKSWARDLPADLVKNAMSISGLYDLEPIMHTAFLQESLRLTPEDARKASPALMPRPRHGKFYTVAGADESEEFLRQNVLIRKAWGERTVPVCEAMLGLNHFSIVDAFAQPGHRLNGFALQLLA